MGNIFFEITIIVVLAAFIAVIFQALRIPAILAYILTGIIIGPFGQLQLQNQETIKMLSEIGIALLLFVVGLELKLKDIKIVGRVALITGTFEIIVTAIVGYFIAILLGFSPIAAFYIGVVLTFSSTIIIVKLLSDKRDLGSLYGKISVGLLLVQDFIAILALILLSGFQKGDAGLSLGSFGEIIAKGIILSLGIIYLSKSVFPRLVDRLARSEEMLFVFSLAWAFGVSALFSSSFVGFSIEIGGFLAGLALANSIESFQIVARVRALRDFFVILFFVFLGMNLTFGNISEIWLQAIALSAFVLIGNPIIAMTIMGFLGYRSRTSFMVGLTSAQISEFSFILVFLGNKIGHLPSEIVSLVTLVGIITFTLSTYMILNGNRLYRFLNPYLGIFEKKNTHEESLGKKSLLKDHIVLAGAGRVGGSIVESLKNSEEKFIVVDFNPDVIKNLQRENITVLFGDITDLDIQELAQLSLAKLVISTITDVEDNLLLLQAVKSENKETKAIVVAQDANEARHLYEAFADYVVLPHLAGGRHVAKIIKENNLDRLETLKALDLAVL